MAIESINTIKSYLTEGKYPTASELVNVIDTLVSIGQNSGGDTSGLAAVAISGDYNDLTNKPTVPAISTNITSDATSDTKTASPKAVKDFVEGKGYLTQHQDISGKADQTDLEALEDRVETLEQGGSGGGDTTQYSYLKLIDDLDAYTEASVGEIVKYNGQTNNKYTNGWDYKAVATGQPVITSIDTSNAPANVQQAFANLTQSQFTLVDDTITYASYIEHDNIKYLYFKSTPDIGDLVYAGDGSGVYHVTRVVNSNDIFIDKNGETELSAHHISALFLTFKNQDDVQLLINSATAENAKALGEWTTKVPLVFIPSESLFYNYTPQGATSPYYEETQLIFTFCGIEWQPVLMPSITNVETDTELSSSSHKPVENATLYEELRIEETGSVLSVNGTNYPIVELDATDFDSIVYTGASDTDFDFKVIPTLDANKAYIIKNANFGESVNDYSFSNQGTFIVKFQSTGSLSEWTSISIGHNKPDAYNYYRTEGTEFNEWLSIPATYQFNVTDNGGYDNDTTIPYYGTPYEDGGNPTITELTNATETTGSASVIKSLKAKVMELEAQIAQISAQLQNIASN